MIPCETCIVFAICKAKLTRLYEERRGHVGWVILKDGCSIIFNFIRVGIVTPEDRYERVKYLESELYRVYGKVFGPSYAFQKRNNIDRFFNPRNKDDNSSM